MYILEKALTVQPNKHIILTDGILAQKIKGKTNHWSIDLISSTYMSHLRSPDTRGGRGWARGQKKWHLFDIFARVLIEDHRRYQVVGRKADGGILLFATGWWSVQWCPEGEELSATQKQCAVRGVSFLPNYKAWCMGGVCQVQEGCEYWLTAVNQLRNSHNIFGIIH